MIYKKDPLGSVLKLKYDVIADDFSKAGEASSVIKKQLSQLAIEAGILRRVAIATYEAEINLVIHSEGGSIEVFIKPNCVEIYVEDIGPGIENLDLAMTKGYSTAGLEAREMGFGAGMGLPNMRKVSDRFAIESVKGDCTKIKMVIDFN